MIKKLLALVVIILIATAVAVAGQPSSEGSDRSAAPGRAKAATPLWPATTAPRVPTTSVGTPTTSAGTTGTTAPVADDRPSSPGGDIEHEWFGRGRSIAVLGDSLTVQARDHLRGLLADDALKVAALFGEGMSGGPLSEGIGSPIMPAVVREYADDPPDVVVVALGTNDVWQPGLGLASFERSWHTMTRSFDEACIVGVTVTETTGALRYSADDAATVNRVIRRTADVVVDWAELGSDPRYTGADQIHLTEEGRRRFAQLIARGVDRCPPPAGGRDR